MPQNHSKPLKGFLPVFLISMLVMFTSCYNFKIATRAQAGTEVSKKTVHSFLWGLAQKPAAITTPICDSLDVNGMSEVTMKTNLGYSLITVLTLGIWCPMKVEYKCSKPCKKTGSL
ncbi:hypothetical protein BH10BAC3_BH10BAC3_39400 [soil metagenome]